MSNEVGPKPWRRRVGSARAGRTQAAGLARPGVAQAGDRLRCAKP